METCCECGTENLGDYEAVSIDVEDDLYLCVGCAGERISNFQSRLDAKSAALKEFGEHCNCAGWDDYYQCRRDGIGCDCGFDAAINK